jgi:hypothetical protein
MPVNLTPQEYLEALQKRIYQEREITGSVNESSPSAEQLRFMEDFSQKLATAGYPAVDIKDIENQARAMFKIECPTRFQDPLGYSMLSAVCDQIETAARKLSLTLPITLPPRPHVGTLPVGSVNAMTIAVPGSDECLVVFETDLVVFAIALSKAIARAMYIGRGQDGKPAIFFKSSDLREIVRHDETIFLRFIETVVAYLVLGTPSAAPMYEPDLKSDFIAKHLSDSMQLFIMGHEYAHIMLGHLNSRKVKAPLGGLEIDKIERDWKQEFDADGWGLVLMLHAMQAKGMDLALSYWGADFFFSCYEIIERGLSLLSTGSESQQLDSSHPPASERRKLLREGIAQLPDAALALELAIKLQVLVEAIWKGVSGVLQAEYGCGQRPASRWR